MKINVQLPRLHPLQQNVLSDPHRFKVMACARRLGKTFTGTQYLLRKCLEKERAEVAWITPFHTQSRKVFREVKKGLKFLEHEKTDSGQLVIQFNKSYLEIEFANGSHWSFFSLENIDAIEGSGIDALVLDEARRVSDPQVWNEIIRPTLSDKQGGGIIMSVPGSKSGWFFTMYRLGLEEDTDIASFKGKFLDNPINRPEEYEAAKKELPRDVFRQQYDAEFLDESDGCFPGFRECIKGEYQPFNHFDRYSIGYDPAGTGGDWNVVSILNEDNHLVRLERWRNRGFSESLDRLERVAFNYGHPLIWLDETGLGKPLLQACQKRKLKVRGYHYTNRSKQDLVQNLQYLIEQKRISFPESPELVSEFESFGYTITPSGLTKYSAPSGMHDDIVNAVALAAMNNSRPRATFRML